MEENTQFALASLGLGLLVLVFGGAIGYELTLGSGIHLSQQAGDVVCQQLTNNTGAYAVNSYENKNTQGQTDKAGSLICKLPSYDHTSQIIIKKGD